MITDNLEVSKKKVDFFVDNLGSGNIVPNHWYHKLLRPCGKSDTTAIAILSELVFLYRYNNQSEFQLNYNYFKNKFNFGINQVKDAVIRLEQAGLLRRDFRTIIVLGRRFTNELYIILNFNNVIKLNKEPGTKKFDLSNGKGSLGYVEFSTDNIETKYLNKKSRSNESNFNPSDFKEDNCDSRGVAFAGLSDLSQLAGNLHVQPLQLALILPNSSKGLAAFHPLSKDDVEWLRIRSGRDFDMNFINRLLLRVGEKYPEKKFYSKPAVLNYMSKVLYGEMRDAVKVSNGCFKFADRSNAKAECLTANNPLQTSEVNSEIISDLYQATTLVPIKDLSIERSTNNAFVNQQSNKINTQFSRGFTTAQQDDSVWSKIRQGLIKSFKNGSGLDVAWFSKLKATCDEDKRMLSLAAPSGVIRDWIKNNYEGVIEQLCAKENYQLNGVFV